ncbi:MAG TPA: DinB family protein [Gemmatimonadales bacterium]|jgi:hypothetical protein
MIVVKLARLGVVSAAMTTLITLPALAHQSRSNARVAPALHGHGHSAMPLPPQSFRDIQLEDLEREREMTLAMLDSMPERLLHYKPVPEVRDFMQQIAHAALTVSSFAATARGSRPPNLGDSTAYLGRRAVMRTAINRSYDFARDVMSGMSAAEYADTVRFFGAPTPRWKVFAAALEHSVWTRGELVDYFRLNGMVPPSFELFPRRRGM